MTPAKTADILRQLHDWLRGGTQWAPTMGAEAVETAIEAIERLKAAESSVAWHQRRWMALQMHQKKMREPERTIVCDILANGELMHPTVAGNRYSVMEKSK